MISPFRDDLGPHTEARARAWALEEIMAACRSLDGTHQVDHNVEWFALCYSEEGPSFPALVSRWAERAGFEDTTMSADEVLNAGTD